MQFLLIYSVTLIFKSTNYRILNNELIKAA